MAHPLTQHPPSTLPFPSAPRPSPLGFGFGLPSTSSSGFASSSSPGGIAFGTPTRSFSSAGQPSLGFGFASTPSLGGGGPSPSLNSPSSFSAFGSPKRQLVRPGPSPSPSAFRSATTPSLKRARRSVSPESAGNSSSSRTASPTPGQGMGAKKDKEDFNVDTLELKDDERRIVRKDVKRVRKDAGAASPKQEQSSDVDMGVLLATLPPTAHLSILLNLITTHPELKNELMDKLPQPDLHECLAQLDKLVDKVKRGVGSSAIQLNQDRVWTRTQKDVETYCRTATTYLSFITSPPTSNSSSPDPQTVQMLLNTLSTQITFLLRLIPPNANTNLGPTQTLLNLGKTLITSWTTWLNAISAEVNQRAGMFPHSTVENWIHNLDTLANTPTHNGGFAWGYPQPSAPEGANALVDSFKGAMGPIRDRFINELGWLIGRRSANAFGSAMQPANTPVWGQPSSSQALTNANNNEDEEL